MYMDESDPFPFEISMSLSMSSFVLFRLIKKRSRNLLCVLDIFSERWQSTLFQFFFITVLAEAIAPGLSVSPMNCTICIPNELY